MMTIKQFCLVPMVVSIFFSSPSVAHESENFCDNTTNAAIKACYFEVKNDYWINLGNCNNLSKKNDREQCARESKIAKKNDNKLCKQQAKSRSAVCTSIGQAPYDPIIDPSMFTDPTEIGKTVTPNIYYPLISGSTWVYSDGVETVTVTVTNKTVEILGVTCIVVTDIVEEDGELVEVTDDWYAQDINGNVWYFGEIAKNYENGAFTDIEGSWKAGVDGAKAGIIMNASPQVGEVYRQEFALGNAEDMGEVLSTTASASVLAAACANDCVLTHDFTPIEPSANEQKYFAPNIGFILETKPDTGERLELVDFSLP